ncbi:MAG: DNA mismatch repair protein MutS [Saprospiraceae bacterium]|nr:DNA mismatch repair protein MutS [Saprospiraceae bacterium]MCF8248389.1 DNA mismatch repair protein MutS [Saprospiraceae bacterium]MCF8280060.1 DNA mismatch repair protein MutS [Bacteroidales bacterium]MCF8309917.1 DNA mismatch repair protein MutS [Saprospiraceae bacterium]MCF8438752.1 DNA mismatch repair protein MutS [Saprospiraceae bacterium]
MTVVGGQKKEKSEKVTPLMAQYFKMKAKHPEAIMLFRVGDFYETFGEDAVKASRALGITLTSRNNGGNDIELAGFPYHSMDVYLPRLVRAGYRVAVCEQLEKPSPENKIVRRGIVEVVTPGVTTDEKLLDHKTNNFLASIFFGKKDQAGIAFLDISTGEFMVAEGDLAYMDKLLQGFNPSEVIFAKSRAKDFEQEFGDRFYTYTIDDWAFTHDFTQEKIKEHFEVASLKGFGIDTLELAQIAAGAALHYLATTENKNLKHITTISRIHQEKYVWLDRFTVRNLELLFSPHEGGTPLITVLDQTVSPMGGRLLKKWVVLPLTSLKEIEARHEVVSFFLQNPNLAEEVSGYIRQMGDLERLISRVPLGKIQPREVVQLRKALEVTEPLKVVLAASGNVFFEKLAEGLNPCKTLQNDIKRQIVDEPPSQVTKGGVVADGFHDELDDLRSTVKNSQALLVGIQQTEAERTGIDNLKIGFNNVFGYYLEVTNRHKDKGLVPDNWVRKQTLTNCERYITDELKKLESKILGAEERMQELEVQIFEALVLSLNEYIQPVQHNASIVARLDCLLSFAKVAEKHSYTRPTLDNSQVIDIRNGRHPVIEQHLPLGESFVPNDVFLDNEEQQIIVITGPNMSGKSALLRQTALISLMAQMGSFVPAQSARLGLIDKVFTRVGASDNLSGGESTFMVEMTETASIMNNISERSLIILDEIGRGTSTYDGISIAWSIAEYLHSHNDLRPKTLFATHYHELNELANKFPRIKNFNVAVKELGQKVIFLRKLLPGGSQHSFGIHVAKMAGMPRSIVERANDILVQLEQQHIEGGESDRVTSSHPVTTGQPKAKKAATNDISAPTFQLSIFETYDPKVGRIKEILLEMDVNTMTPVECLMRLNELKRLAEEG